jgi:hypothetical protein
MIHQAYDWTEASMKELLLSSAKYISFTTDLWTSRAKHGYIGITASFMDNDFKIYDILLECKYLPYPHDAITIKESLISLINSWNFQNNIVAITSDNGKNMVKAISYLPSISRIPCSAHTLQLVVGKALEPTIIFMARAKRLIRFFQYPKQLERLLATQKNLGYINEVGVIQDVSTRWNSSFLAWERLLYLKDAIDQLAIDLTRDQDNNIKKDGRRLKKFNLSDEEWIFMENLVDLLSILEEATTILGGSNYVTLSLMYPTISELKNHFSSNNNNTENIDLTNNTTIFDNEEEEEDYFEESDNNTDEIVNPITHHRININQPMSTEGIINQVKSIISQALDKYWDVPSEIGLKAAYLDPRFKNLLFTTREEKLKIEEILHNELQEMIELSSLTTLPVSPNENLNTNNMSDNNIINGK